MGLEWLSSTSSSRETFEYYKLVCDLTALRG